MDNPLTTSSKDPFCDLQLPDLLNEISSVDSEETQSLTCLEKKRISSSSGCSALNEIIVTPSRTFSSVESRRGSKLTKLLKSSPTGKLRLVCLTTRTITMQMPHGMTIESFNVVRMTDKVDVSSQWQSIHVSVSKNLIKFETPDLNQLKPLHKKKPIERQPCFTFTLCSFQHTTYSCDVVFVGKTLYHQSLQGSVK